MCVCVSVCVCMYASSGSSACLDANLRYLPASTLLTSAGLPKAAFLLYAPVKVIVQVCAMCV
jgi:hypothetical protein